MKNKLIVTGLSFVVLALFMLNTNVALAHNWGLWCWHTGRTINVWVIGTHRAESNAALNDWDSHTDVNFRRTSSHSQISVFGANYGPMQWGGLATIKNYSFDWWHHWWWCRVTHAHSAYNSFYGGSGGTGTGSAIRGIQCQEIGHTLGLDHSNHGCMGKSYFNNLNITVSHNWSDINARF